MRKRRFLVAVAAVVGLLTPALGTTASAEPKLTSSKPSPDISSALPGRLVKVPESIAGKPPPSPIAGVQAQSYWIVSWFYDGANSMCLDADTNGSGNGVKVQLWRCNRQTQQMWWLYDLGGDNFLIQNGYHGSYLDAHLPCIGQNGCRVQFWQYVGGNTNQVWHWFIDRHSRDRIQNAATPNKQLDANRNGGPSKNGTTIQLWDLIDGQDNQQWSVQAVT